MRPNGELLPHKLKLLMNSLLTAALIEIFKPESKNFVQSLSDIVFDILVDFPIGSVAGNVSASEILNKCEENAFEYESQSEFFSVNFTTGGIILEKRIKVQPDCLAEPDIPENCAAHLVLKCRNPVITEVVAIEIIGKFSTRHFTLSLPENTGVNRLFSLQRGYTDSAGNDVTGYSLTCKKNCYGKNSRTFGIRKFPIMADILYPLEVRKELDHETVDHYIFKVTAYYPGIYFL